MKKKIILKQNFLKTFLILLKFLILNSFQKLETWLEELEVNTNRNITKMIVANKIDLQGERKVDREQGKKFAKQQRALFVETSAASNINVQMAFEELVKKILEDNIFDDQNGVARSDIRLTGMHNDQNQQPASGSCGGGFCGRWGFFVIAFLMAFCFWRFCVFF